MLYKVALGLLATAVVGEELAIPERRRRAFLYSADMPIYLLANADKKSWKDKEGNAIDLNDFKKKDLIQLDKGVMKKLMKVKKKMKKIKKKCERRRSIDGISSLVAAEGISAISKAEGIIGLSKAEGEGSSKKKGNKKKYKKMTKEELIELVSMSAMDVEKAKKKLAKLKKKCA